MAVKLPPRRPAGRGGPIARTPVKAPPRPGLTGKNGGSVDGPYINIRPPKPGLGAGPKPKPGVDKGPAAPKPLIAQPTAPDATYNDQVDLATRRERAALGSLDAQESAVKHDFGIEDPTNPFSRAEGLKRAFLARQRAASASLASRGQLYSGAHERALARTRLEEEQARAGLRSAYEDALSQIGQARTGAQFQTEEEKAAAFEKWLARAPEAEGPGPTIDAGPPAAAAPNTEPGLRHGTGPVTLPPGIGPIAPLPTEKPVAAGPPVAQRTVTKKPKVKPKPAPRVKPKNQGKGR